MKAYFVSLVDTCHVFRELFDDVYQPEESHPLFYSIRFGCILSFFEQCNLYETNELKFQPKKTIGFPFSILVIFLDLKTKKKKQNNV